MIRREHWQQTSHNGSRSLNPKLKLQQGMASEFWRVKLGRLWFLVQASVVKDLGFPLASCKKLVTRIVV